MENKTGSAAEASAKAGKYLKYAIGEIALVIIGILIALTINQKVKDNSNDVLRDLYINQLVDEADRNIASLSETVEGAIQAQTELDTIIQLLLVKDYENPKILSKLSSTFSVISTHPSTVTFDNLKSTGDLKLFKDLELRNTITHSYETFEDIRFVETLDYSTVQIFLQDYFYPNARFFDLSQSSDNFAVDAYFENITGSRHVTIGQIIDACHVSIDSIEELKLALADEQ